MTTFQLKAIAQTSYQLQSVRNFGTEIKHYPNGTYVFCQEFETEQEAKNYLISRAENYFETEEEINEAIEEINTYGSIRMDAVNGRIEKITE